MIKHFPPKKTADNASPQPTQLQVAGRKAAAQALARFGEDAKLAPRALPRLLRLVQKVPGF